jgi:hypothetical protein
MRPADLGYTMPAEWAPHAGCWMAWPKRDGTLARVLRGGPARLCARRPGHRPDLNP